MMAELAGTITVAFSWTIVTHCSTVCRTLTCASWSLCRTPLYDWSLSIHLRARQVQSSVSGLPVTVWSGASLLDGWLLPRVRQHATLCSRLMFRLGSYGNRTIAAAGPHSLFQSRCTIQTSPTDCLDDGRRDTFFEKHEHGALWLLICGALEKHLLNSKVAFQGTPFVNKIRMQTHL